MAVDLGSEEKLACGHALSSLVYACGECAIPEKWMADDMKADRDALIKLSHFLEERNMRLDASSVQSAMSAIEALENQNADAKAKVREAVEMLDREPVWLDQAIQKLREVIGEE